MFEDRHDAGRRLAKKLEHYHGRDAVVLALPRGGVVVGHKIAQTFKIPLDIITVRKVGHPNSPEYAICAVDEKETILCNKSETELVNQVWLKEEIKRQQKEALRRSILYKGARKPENIHNKIVIIADDGVATGLSLRLAIIAVKAKHPKNIIVAVPVISEEAAENIKADIDELITLESPSHFLGAVGSHYERFEQVEDGEVIDLLKSCSV